MPPKAKGYKMPDPLPKGEILQDALKRKFKLGVSIGKGGFGEIYSAQQGDSKSSTQYPYVVKIEPHSNGPLFVEMHFYTRNAKEDDIKAFKTSKKLKNLGMPLYVASGSHEHKGEKYRFLVMEKFSKDITKLLKENNDKFPEATVYKLGLQIVDVLEYIHSRGYVHADIKGANILLSLKNENQVYLVDYGLATKFSTDAEFKPNPKKMHDGTIEYLSRDAHQGVPTRRGDLEILAYNLIQWFGCKLPWASNTTNPKIVQSGKEKYMNDIPLFMKTCFGSNPPDTIVKLLNYINKLKFNEEPDYDKVRSILKSGLKEVGSTESSPLQFKEASKRKSNSTSVRSKKSRQIDSEEEDDELESEEDSNMKATPSKFRKGKEISKKKLNSTPLKTKKSKKEKFEEEEDDEEIKENLVGDERRNLKRKLNSTPLKIKKTVQESEDEDSSTKENFKSPALNATPSKRKNKNIKEVEASPRNKNGIKNELRGTPRTRKLYDEQCANGIIPTISIEASSSEENVSEKYVPKKRTRRINTVSTIDENGVVHNSEMLRIKKLMEEKAEKRTRVKRGPAKLNKSLDVIEDSDDEPLTIYVPVRRARVLN